MTIGRIFPIPNPNRVFPVDPIATGQTDRNSPLPFVIGVGTQSTIETTYQIGFILQRFIIQVTPDDQGGAGAIVTCTSTTNLYCVPQAVVTQVASPTAIVRCAQ
jgi:hypothetical protein